LATPFDYNDIASLRRALTDGTEPCAAVIMEPVRYIAPLPGYLAEVARVSREFGAILIFDEICTGFHLGLGGAQKRFGITPDLACFGKALGNGFPIACVVGRSDMMSVFTEIYTSSTFGAEAASLAAARAVMDVLSSTDALKQMYNRAKRLALTFDALCADAGLGAMFRSIGFPTRSFISIKAGNTSDVARALFRQETREERIIICGGHNFCTAHDDQAIDETILKYQAVLRRLAQWLSDKAPEAHLMRRTGHIHARE
jgi:glutamate-1-semialdehyde 2,1-aminomutase/spore coat polysaccharide biosynthesis protein SpsF